AAAVGLFKGCTAFVLASRADEGLPMVLIEAMAAGRPAIASRVGGVPEIIVDGATGLLVERADPAALAGAITKLLLDPAAAAQMGRAARQRADQFAWPLIASQY